MNVSKQWLQDYVNFQLPSTSELVERIGAQLGGVEGVSTTKEKYEGVTVARVVSCSKLENSDHLNLCFIDDGGVVQNVPRRDDGMVQVVCGAPNVQTGVMVAWLPPGATVPSTFDADPFVLEARELRGALSNGMLASPKELAIGDAHEGILLLDDNLQPGKSFVEAYQLDDAIIDIENKMFTHRPDCFGQLGVAREVAGIFGQQFSSPQWYTSPAPITASEGLGLTIHNDAPQDVPRFMAVSLKNVTIGQSPIWLQTYLSRVGIRPINNVVDITNYLMMLTGQPLHAYDYDKVAKLSDAEGAVLSARYAKPNEQIELLSGKTVQARGGAIVIATDTQAIGLAGVMGGANTEVDANTQHVVLECASFDMYSIRRTSMAHGLFTDAVTRFNKGQSPLQNPAVLTKAVAMFAELAGAQVASAVLDSNNADAAQPVVRVSANYINARLGLELSSETMAALLRNVEFEVAVAEQELTVSTPFWRTDIAEPEDVMEEIGRLYGFDKLPLVLPTRSTQPAQLNTRLKLKSAIRDSLRSAGANELLTYSFVHSDVLQKSGQSAESAYRVTNALSPDLQYYRYNALSSLLDKVHANIKAGHDEFVLFELAKGHDTTMVDDNGLPVELELLDAVYASKQPRDGAAMYMARRYIDALAADLRLDLEYHAITDELTGPATASFDPARTAKVQLAGDNSVVLGFVGEFKQSVTKAFKLPRYAAGFSINRDQLLQVTQQGVGRYVPLPKFPKIEQDICLRTATDVSFSRLQASLSKALEQHKPAHSILKLTPIDVYQKDDDAKQTTLRVSVASYDKTMTDQEISQLLDTASQQVAQDLGAERV